MGPRSVAFAHNTALVEVTSPEATKFGRLLSALQLPRNTMIIKLIKKRAGKKRIDKPENRSEEINKNMYFKKKKYEEIDLKTTSMIKSTPPLCFRNQK
jgi:hypothetical protein